MAKTGGEQGGQRQRSGDRVHPMDVAAQNVRDVMARRGVPMPQVDGFGHPDTTWKDGNGNPVSRQQGSNTLTV